MESQAGTVSLYAVSAAFPLENIMTPKIEELLITLTSLILAFAFIIIGLKYHELTVKFIGLCLIIMAVRGINRLVNNILG